MGSVTGVERPLRLIVRPKQTDRCETAGAELVTTGARLEAARFSLGVQANGPTPRALAG